MNENAHNQISILIVDDVPSARAVLKDMLTEFGFTRVLEASDGRHAAAILKRVPIDLVLCDQVMPDMSGKELLLYIRRTLRNEKLPVIFVSSLGAVSDVEEVLNLQATDYLVKPISMRKLRRKLEEALRLSNERIEISADEAGTLSHL